MADLKTLSLNHVDAVLASCEQVRKDSKHDDYSGGKATDEAKYACITRARAAIQRVSGSQSVYNKQAEVHHDGTGHPGYVLQHLVGTLKALRDDLDHGLTTSFSDILHAEMFADYLEMAQHLLDEGYKDAAAVIAGSTLEEHLRQMCVKNSIDITFLNAKGETKPKKANTMNTDLAKTSVVKGLDQKNVVSWLDLRNKAAHGKYAEYTKEQVGNMLSGIREFVARHPA